LLKKLFVRKDFIEFGEILSMIGWGEFALIIVLAVILLGPDNLTDIARKLGRLYAEYNRAKRRLELEIKYGIPIDDRMIREVDIYNEKQKVVK